MKLEEIEEFQVSPRWKIEPGAIVRLSGGGPQYTDPSGEKRRYTLPGAYRVRAIYRAGRVRHRFYLEVSGIDRIGGTYTVFVGGKPYRSAAGLLVRPYRLKRQRSQRHAAAR